MKFNSSLLYNLKNFLTHWNGKLPYPLEESSLPSCVTTTLGGANLIAARSRGDRIGSRRDDESLSISSTGNDALDGESSEEGGGRRKDRQGQEVR